MNTESLFFDSIREDRGWYFVEYSPPNSGFRFATVQLIAVNEHSIVDVVNAMEEELAVWAGRYPIPIMVTAFGPTGAAFDLSEMKPCSHLMGYLEDGTREVKAFWRLLESHEMPATALNRDRLEEIYATIPHRTGADLRAAAYRRARELRKGLRIAWSFVFIWAVLIPVTIAVLGTTSVVVGVVAMAYSILKGVLKALRLCGVLRPSARERERDRENALMRHHHYHCVQNPEGFQRLKLENFEREERERIPLESKSIDHEVGCPHTR